jgi:glycine/D-amino acid oxidase-like deaminating enzyme
LGRLGTRSIAIIGAGFSGSTLALHLLRHGPNPAAMHLIERTGRFVHPPLAPKAATRHFPSE